MSRESLDWRYAHREPTKQFTQQICPVCRMEFRSDETYRAHYKEKHAPKAAK